MTTPFIHPQAICETSSVGRNTRVWAFAHLLPGARVGADCNICDGVFIENDVVLGDRVTVKCGVQLWDGLRVEDDVFIGPNATFTNDLYPRSRKPRGALPPILICRGASIGANATVLPGLRIGPGALVGAGTIVTQDVPANAVVAGNPARIVGYADAREIGDPRDLGGDAPGRAIEVEAFRDSRGRLALWPLAAAVPFIPRQMYIVDGAPDGGARGGGAYRRSHQLLVATKGAMRVALDDGSARIIVTLSETNIGLHISPGIWTLQFGHTTDAALLVLASGTNLPEERVTDYIEFSVGGLV